MALSRQSLSPTSNLLRNSRLFSLPNPLARPPVSDTYGAGISKSSDTATLPYPTHQAIATTKSSLARGDWGLKRPIPSRSHLVQVSDPVLRVTQLDTIEHVTDFESAADHVRTRQKWEEMGVPMIKGLSLMRNRGVSDDLLPGAFEVRDDTTSYDTDLGLDEAGLYLKALKKSMPSERVKAQWDDFNATWRKRWEEKLASFRARGWGLHLSDFKSFQKEASRKSSNDKPWLEEFVALQKEQRNARNALKQRLEAPQTPGSLQFTPFTPPPVDPVVHNTRRWKHEGPWLPGMGAEDFISFLTKKLAGRKKEFNDYLVEYVKNKIYDTRRLAASISGELAPIDAQEAEVWQEQREKAWRHITKPEIDAGIKALRQETAKDPLSSKLVSKLILPFLKLPAIRFKHTAYNPDAAKNEVDQYQFDQETAPLSTHPSAGLGYLRHKSYLANHPILGPQENPAPIPARVMQARRTGTKNELYARLGVGGFVANDDHSGTTSYTVPRNYAAAKDVETIDVDTPGGRKIMVQPQFGSVTNDGRIQIKLKRSVGQEVAVGRGEFDEKPPARPYAEKVSFRNLVGGAKKSGIKELDEQSEQGQQFSEFLESTKPQGHAQPPRGFPGMAEALRGD
ncbi:uncharacterized protein J4E87_008753 [Alternaria ethzedia]|uniref:uncharacterized protein n=1 Tax=Alternaria ethzedia TaxID=181014 RepID=UPI0020C576EF|nr:uncharacterized protein J4E87_008753 [Alternaria ethzedia]XP_051327162.1 uncharacterized protein J4E85_004694 [Alternaria conjuncta]KAI4616241.1 hypothetical protein J4E87_008753 [Alternaria ethzedia]KAI4930070.1 hypothetical protein J4E85_004694 [Alternaria conjuncta]